jgi:hypothetical protein
VLAEVNAVVDAVVVADVVTVTGIVDVSVVDSDDV